MHFRQALQDATDAPQTCILNMSFLNMSILAQNLQIYYFCYKLLNIHNFLNEQLVSIQEGFFDIFIFIVVKSKNYFFFDRWKQIQFLKILFNIRKKNTRCLRNKQNWQHYFYQARNDLIIFVIYFLNSNAIYVFYYVINLL